MSAPRLSLRHSCVFAGKCGAPAVALVQQTSLVDWLRPDGVRPMCAEHFDLAATPMRYTTLEDYGPTFVSVMPLPTRQAAKTSSRRTVRLIATRVAA